MGFGVIGLEAYGVAISGDGVRAPTEAIKSDPQAGVVNVEGRIDPYGPFDQLDRELVPSRLMADQTQADGPPDDGSSRRRKAPAG
jgi:hypothetical protein